MKPRRILPVIVPVILLCRIAYAAAAPLPPIGDWQGHYRCSQGETALDLEITAITPSRLEAVFYFHPLRANPGVPRGCFAMRGSFDPATGAVTLTPAGWLDQPPFFVSVGLSGTVSGQTLAGTVNGPACSTFSLTRGFSPPVPPAPAPCHMAAQEPVA